MDPVTAIGLAASIISLTEFTFKVIQRSTEYHRAGARSPTAFQDIETRLPLIAETLKNIRAQYCNDESRVDTVVHLQTVIDGLKRSIESFDRLLTKLKPSAKDETGKKESSLSISWKAFRSVNKEKDVRRIDQNIQSYLTTLIAYIGSVPPPYKQERCEDATQLLDTVPARAVPRFVGRTLLLEMIDAIFGDSASSIGRAKVLALCGMGGQGKTQMALEYCRRRKLKSSLIWVDATSQKKAYTTLEELAPHLGVRPAEAQHETVRGVVKTLASHKSPLLMVFDNYDRPEEFPTLQDLFPSSENCHVVITSRHGATESLGQAIHVPPFTLEEGLELLQHRAGAPFGEIAHDNARQIVQQLGLLPLAIEQAAAYIATRKLNYKDFLDHYEKRKTVILKETPKVWTYSKSDGEKGPTRDLSVFTTWELSLVELGSTAEERQPYLDLLVVSSYFDFTNISDTTFSAYFKNLQNNGLSSGNEGSLTFLMTLNDTPSPSHGAQGLWDPFVFQDAVARLHNASLIRSMSLQGEKTVFSLHPLVAEWLKMRKDEQSRPHLLHLAIDILVNIAYQSSYSSTAWNLRDVNEILRHVNNVYTTISGPGVSDELRKRFYDQAGYLARFYVTHSKYWQAKQLIRQALDSGLLGSGRVAYLEGILGEIYLDEGNVEEADVLILRAYESRKKAFGAISAKSDSRILRTLERVGFLRTVQRRLDEAETLYREALNGWLENGQNHRDVLQAERMLGQVLRMQGKSDECEVFLQNAARGFEQLEGLRNHRTAAARSALAMLYRDRGQLETAAAILYECAIILEGQAGRSNIRTVAAYIRLGLIEEEMGKSQQASKYYKCALPWYNEDKQGDTVSITPVVFLTILGRTLHEFSYEPSTFDSRIGEIVSESRYRGVIT